MKILIHGSTGRMGRILCDMLTAGYPGLELEAQVSPEAVADPANGIYTDLRDVDRNVDCVIDFSHHTAVGSLMTFCVEKNIPVVVATTGHTPEEKEVIADAAKKIPVFFSANMSIGVALLAELAAKTAAVSPMRILRSWRSTTTRSWMCPAVPRCCWPTVFRRSERTPCFW